MKCPEEVHPRYKPCSYTRVENLCVCCLITQNQLIGHCSLMSSTDFDFLWLAERTLSPLLQESPVWNSWFICVIITILLVRLLLCWKEPAVLLFLLLVFSGWFSCIKAQPPLPVVLWLIVPGENAKTHLNLAACVEGRSVTIPPHGCYLHKLTRLGQDLDFWMSRWF